jgi:Mg-chelatase subunit ChlD/Icc-related predicted phosphoesterase
MRRRNDIKKEVTGPQTGLVTRFPTDLTGAAADKALSSASNVRAQDGSLSNAPGYERVVIDGDPLDSAPISIWQANILSTSRDARKSVLVGTRQRAYELKRRAVEIDCSDRCAIKFAFVADHGKIGDAAFYVSDMVRRWNPDVVVHGGDLVYSDGYDNVGGNNPSRIPYEDLVAQYYWPFIGGYNGPYGLGPGSNKFFPTIGNHDLTDWPHALYKAFFNLPGNERYYDFKAGPVHFIMLNSNESAYSAYDGYDAIAAASTQQLWASALIAASDCPWVVVIGHAPPYSSGLSHPPGLTDVRWLDSESISLGLFGHAHNYERLASGGNTYINAGTGGHTLRGFGTPLAESVFRDFANYGAVLVEADNDSLVAKYYHLDGTLVDTYTNTTPIRALSLCYSNRIAKSLEVVPDFGEVEIGQSFQYQAFVTYEDGTREDVTDKATTWAVFEGTIATIDKGKAYGVNLGTTTISATHGGLTAEAGLTVKAQCVDIRRDWIFCVERTESMEQTAGSKRILSHLAEAMVGCTENMQEIDKSGVTSFAGDYATQLHDAYINHPLDSDKSQTVREFESLRGTGDSDISAGLDLCYEQLLDADVHNTDDRGMVVLIVDGPARITDPGGDGTMETAMAAAVVSADRIKTLPGAILVVIGYNVDTTYTQLVRDLATPGYYFDIRDIDELRRTIEQLPGIICEFGDNPYAYGYACVSPQLDYTGFINWDVTNGVVDLCGEGTNGIELYNQFPGNGLYVDMVGTNPNNSLGNKSRNGHLTSKVAYTFEAGKKYKFSIDVSGTGRQENEFPMSVRCWIGGLLDVRATKGPGTQDQTFSTFSWEFDGAAGSEFIQLIMERQPDDPISVVGIFIKDVKLENLTDTTIMLLDSFDGENACPP